MSIVEQIGKNLVNPNKHNPILKALVDILEEQGEKGAKDRIKKWVEEIGMVHFRPVWSQKVLDTFHSP